MISWLMNSLKMQIEPLERLSWQFEKVRIITLNQLELLYISAIHRGSTDTHDISHVSIMTTLIYWGNWSPNNSPLYPFLITCSSTESPSL